MPKPMAAATVAFLVIAAPAAAPVTPARVEVVSVSTLPQPESASNAASKMRPYIPPRGLFLRIYAPGRVPVRCGEPAPVHGVLIEPAGHRPASRREAK